VCGGILCFKNQQRLRLYPKRDSKVSFKKSQKMHQKVSKYGLLQEIPCFFSTEFKKKIYQKRKLPI